MNPAEDDATLATRLLERLGRGDQEAARELLTYLYDELHRIARRCMAEERVGHTLQPTALVHEAWMRISGPATPAWESRAHFLRLAARAMRNVLVDSARRRKAHKRGEGEAPLALEEVVVQYEQHALDLVALDAALEKLQAMDEPLARIVELRFFAGLTIEESARVLGVSTPTVERGWRVARMWLRREVPGAGDEDPEA